MPNIDSVLKDKEQLLGLAQAEVESAIKERDAVTIRWNDYVAQRKAKVSTLQMELSDLKDKLKEQKNTPGSTAGSNLKKEVRGKKPG